MPIVGNDRIYITAAIDYVNARPHIGHALEKIQADVLARYYRKKGYDTRLVMGTDENALKNVLAAREAGVSTRDFVDKNAEVFRGLKQALGLSWDDFIRTTEARHIAGVEAFWRACKKDDIYKKAYRGFYCVGCEEFKTEKTIVSGTCPEHPTLALEAVEEENYFFRLSAYEDRVHALIASDEIRIVPEARKNEMLSFIREGLEDFSISRSRARAGDWGIPVPGDPEQVIYVWFDALVNYITALGYGADDALFRHYWKDGGITLHVIGKGITRFHAVYWPAMLLSAHLPLPRTIFVHGYVTAGGQKMSKSVGNVVDPFAVVEKYGADAVRYYFLREMPAYEDGDYTEEKFVERYSADLANGIGNFAARVTTLAANAGPLSITLQAPAEVMVEIARAQERVEAAMRDFKFHEALIAVMALISYGDGYVNARKPWETRDAGTIFALVAILEGAAQLLLPFLPDTAEKILAAFKRASDGMIVQKVSNLFPRLSIPTHGTATA